MKLRDRHLLKWARRHISFLAFDPQRTQIMCWLMWTHFRCCMTPLRSRNPLPQSGQALEPGGTLIFGILVVESLLLWFCSVATSSRRPIGQCSYAKCSYSAERPSFFRLQTGQTYAPVVSGGAVSFRNTSLCRSLKWDRIRFRKFE
jgi:hypothetical protein